MPRKRHTSGTEVGAGIWLIAITLTGSECTPYAEILYIHAVQNNAMPFKIIFFTVI